MEPAKSHCTHLIHFNCVEQMVQATFEQSLHLIRHQSMNATEEYGGTTNRWRRSDRGQVLPIIEHHIHQFRNTRQPIVHQYLRIGFVKLVTDSFYCYEIFCFNHWICGECERKWNAITVDTNNHWILHACEYDCVNVKCMLSRVIVKSYAKLSYIFIR